MTLSAARELAATLPAAPHITRPSVETHRAHLVGVCGSGMKALAEYLTSAGWQLSGSDQQLSSETSQMLTRRGLRLHQGHSSRFLPAATDLLIYSPAVKPENPERQAAQQRGIPQFSYTQMLGRLMQGKTGISIAGTHGKSTTTAMVGRILQDGGHEPSVIVGAEARGSQSSGWAGSGDLFVVESCEFQRGFLDLSPQLAAILGIEADHFDCYRDLAETTAAFAEFARRVPADGLVLIHQGCAASQTATAEIQAERQTFALQPGADWWAADLRSGRDGTRFRIFRGGEYFTEVALRIPGEHNVLNALAAAAITYRAGATVAAIRAGLEEFSGVRRRLEVVGTWRGVSLVDDYAHHPTAVRASLATVRRQFPGRKLWCVFQPHQVSRTLALLDEFADSFGAADEVVIVPVFAAREQVRAEPLKVGQELAARILSRGKPVRFCGALDRAVATLDDDLRPGDVLVTMGAGNISQVHHAFTQRLQRHYPPR